MSLTTDPNHPELGKWDGKPEDAPTPQNKVYLVLSQEEIAKGFKRPYRDAYTHVGIPSPKFPLRDFTEEERARWGGDYVKFEPYPEGYKGSATGHLGRKQRSIASGRAAAPSPRWGARYRRPTPASRDSTARPTAAAA